MCRVTMRQTYVHRISSKSLRQRTGMFELEHYLASLKFLWATHVALVPKSRLPKSLLLPWMRAPRATAPPGLSSVRTMTTSRAEARIRNMLALGACT